MSLIIKSGDSANTAIVNDDGELLVRLTDDEETAGFVRVAGALYSGEEGEEMRVSEDGYLMVGQESMLFYDQVEGNTLHSHLWATSTSTMTITQSAGLISLNAGLSTATGTYAILSSIKHIPLYGQYPLIVSFSAEFNNAAQANATMEIGIGLVSGTSAPTDGVFMRFAPSGQILGVINYGGVEVETVLTFDPDDNPFAINTMYPWSIVVDNDDVHFLHGSDVAAVLACPTNQPFPTAAARLPLFARVFNGGTAPSTAPRIRVGRFMVVQSVLNQERLWTQTLAALGRGAYQNPVASFAQIANHTNSTNPSSATLSNTAAGYTTLGGRFQFAAVAGAATDFALFAYQVPSGFQLFVTGVCISCVNTGAQNSISTPTVLDWSMGVNSSAVSLATADGATTWAPRRVPLGMQAFQAGAAIGAQVDDMDRDFPVPYVVDSGRYLHVILQVPIGAATATQVIRGDVLIHGFFE